MLADLLLGASSPLCITLLYQRASIILPTETDLSTIFPVFAVEYIRAVELHLSGVDILDHILFDLGVVVQHCKTMGHVTC